MAVCSLYEISSFLNLCLKIPGCIPIEQNSLTVWCSPSGSDDACLFGQVGGSGSSRSIQVSGSKNRCSLLRKDLPVHAPTRYWAGSPRPVRVGVVVPSTRIPGGPYENYGNISKAVHPVFTPVCLLERCEFYLFRLQPTLC